MQEVKQVSCMCYKKIIPVLQNASFIESIVSISFLAYSVQSEKLQISDNELNFLEIEKFRFTWQI